MAPLAYLSSLDPMVTGYKHSQYTAGSRSHPHFSHLFVQMGARLNPAPLLSVHTDAISPTGLTSVHDHESRGASAQSPYSVVPGLAFLQQTFSSNFQTLLPTSLSDEILILHLWENWSNQERTSVDSNQFTCPCPRSCTPVLWFQPATTDELSGLLSEAKPCIYAPGPFPLSY